MRKKKGVALPTAIALCSVLLIVSFAVTGAILGMVSLNKVERILVDNDLEFLKAHQKFVANNGPSDAEIAELLGDVNFIPHVYVYEDGDVKSLVAWNKSESEIKYYSIVDFSDSNNIKILAYQTDHLYVTEDESNWYVGGLIQIAKE